MDLLSISFPNLSSPDKPWRLFKFTFVSFELKGYPTMRLTAPLLAGSIGQTPPKSAPLPQSHAEAIPFREPLIADTLSLRQAPHSKNAPRFGSAPMPGGGGGWDPNDPRNFFNRTFPQDMADEGPPDWNPILGNGQFETDASASQIQNPTSSSYISKSKYAPKGGLGETQEKVLKLMCEPGADISQVAKKLNRSYSRVAWYVQNLRNAGRLPEKWTPNVLRECILQWYLSQPNAKKKTVAEGLDVAPRTVQRYVQALRKDGLLPKRGTTEELQESIWQRMSKDGATISNTAKELEITNRTVQRHMKAFAERKQKAKNSVSQYREGNRSLFTPFKEVSPLAQHWQIQQEIRSSDEHTDSSASEAMQASSFTQAEAARRQKLLKELDKIDAQAAERAADPGPSTRHVIEELEEAAPRVTILSRQQGWDYRGRPYIVYNLSDGTKQRQWQ
jgi:transposase